MSRERLFDIDRAKGLAIFFVVLGHIAIHSQPDVPDWYLFLRWAIYKFHMPFFMFLSGMIFSYTYKPVKNASEYIYFIRSKVFRLMPAFFLFGILTLTGKMLTGNIMYVENIPSNYIEGLLEILISPGTSAAGSLWFIYVLFEFYLIFPLLLVIFRGNIWVIFVLSVPAYFLPNVPYLLMGAAANFALFFAAGIVAMNYYQHYQRFICSYRWLFLVIFLGSYSTELIFDYGIPKVLIGLCSIPAFHALVATSPLSNSRSLYVLGMYSFPIYLMNMIIIGLLKGLFLKFSGWSGNLFFIYLITLLLFGLCGPILIKKYIFSRIPVLDRITT